MQRLLLPLWSHTRDIVVAAYKHKTVYEIPLVFESVPKNLTVFVRDGKIVVEATTQKGQPSDTVSKYNQPPV
jgi:hypothetical protein